MSLEMKGLVLTPGRARVRHPATWRVAEENAKWRKTALITVERWGTRNGFGLCKKMNVRRCGSSYLI